MFERRLSTLRFHAAAKRPLLAGFVGVVAVAAAPGVDLELRGGPRVTVSAGETIDADLYASGEVVTIDGVVRGDVVAAAREIWIQGRVEGDVIAAGQVVVIEGEVGDDVRVAGMTLRFGRDARIGDHVMAAGYSLETEDGSRVTGKLYFSGPQAALAGDVDGSVELSAQAVELSGNVGGNVEAKLGTAAARFPEMFLPTSVGMRALTPGLEVTDTSRIGGRLDYRSPTEAGIGPSAQISGGVGRSDVPATSQSRPTMVDRLRSQLLWLLGCLIFGLALLLAAPRWTRNVSALVQVRPLRSLGMGIVAIVMFLAAAVGLMLLTGVFAIASGVLSLGRLVAAAVLTGLLGEGILAVLFWIAVSFLAPIVVGYTIGRLVVGRVSSSAEEGRVLPLFLGLAVLALVGLVPYVDTIASFSVVMIGLGASWSWSRQKIARLPTGALS